MRRFVQAAGVIAATVAATMTAGVLGAVGTAAAAPTPTLARDLLLDQTDFPQGWYTSTDVANPGTMYDGVAFNPAECEAAYTLGLPRSGPSGAFSASDGAASFQEFIVDTALPVQGIFDALLNPHCNTVTLTSEDGWVDTQTATSRVIPAPPTDSPLQIFAVVQDYHIHSVDTSDGSVYDYDGTIATMLGVVADRTVLISVTNDGPIDVALTTDLSAIAFNKVLADAAN